MEQKGSLQTKEREHICPEQRSKEKKKNQSDLSLVSILRVVQKPSEQLTSSGFAWAGELDQIDYIPPFNLSHSVISPFRAESSWYHLESNKILHPVKTASNGPDVLYPALLTSAHM